MISKKIHNPFNNVNFLHTVSLSLLSFFTLSEGLKAEAESKQPNVIIILADDLGYGNVGFNGSTRIKTPNLDKMAKEGMRFNAMYAPCSVCGPSRASLMFGQHLGHCKIRGNPLWSLPASQGEAAVNIEESDKLLPSYLKKAGYATGCFGKWGLNENLEENSGHPNKHGFDEFWGFNTHKEAHFHWPDFVWHNSTKVDLGSGGKNWDEKLIYADTLFTEKCVAFIETQAKSDQPFFAYLSLTSPHLGNSVPEQYSAAYQDKNWPKTKDKGGHYRNDKDQNAAYAGMISHMDAMTGIVKEKLEKLHIAENTLVIFTSDNGPHWNLNFFNEQNIYRGGKRSLNEGGIRMPTVAWWPGTVKANSTTDLPVAFWDILPTFCELAGTQIPKDTDGISFVPELTGKGEQLEHPYLFWYFNEKNGPQLAARFGNWKAIQTWDLKNNKFKQIQLYDLKKDPSEKKDLSKAFPKIKKQADQILKEAWVEDPNYPQIRLTPPKKNKGN